MRVPRSYIGKQVELVWRDPRGVRVSCQIEQVLKGMAALATWKERGVIDDLTDGVVRIIHSEGHNPIDPDEHKSTPEYQVTWVPEALVESITIMEPMKTEQDPANS
jgi:hypothetical protein